ncbi:GntR family transcriptional regulator [Myxococcus stipitatus]|uniref:FadR/GntR family transcriptional regulator n=1 Tax=Myxococcus stipitatus TaxID=83455 RepID=UPI0031450C54
MPGSSRQKPQRAAELVLEALCVAIFDGKLKEGDPLPPERVLAETHGVSRIIARQAVHTLVDAGLVEARQGGASRVLDVAAADARALELLFRYGSRLRGGGARLREELVEYRLLYVVMMLDAAHRKATDEERRALLAFVEACPAQPSEARARQLDTEFWRHVTAMGRNQIMRMEMALWERWADPSAPLDGKADELRWFYHVLAKQLLSRQDPIPFYLATIRPTFAPASR